MHKGSMYSKKKHFEENQTEKIGREVIVEEYQEEKPKAVESYISILGSHISEKEEKVEEKDKESSDEDRKEIFESVTASKLLCSQIS